MERCILGEIMRTIQYLDLYIGTLRLRKADTNKYGWLVDVVMLIASDIASAE